MSRDDVIEQTFRAGSGEQPSAAADAAILALARAAAEETQAAALNAAVVIVRNSGSATSPRPAAQVSLLHRWRAPLGLAATLVLVIGIVSRVQVEEDAGMVPGSVQSAASAPQTDQLGAAEKTAKELSVIASASTPGSAPSHAGAGRPLNAQADTVPGRAPRSKTTASSSDMPVPFPGRAREVLPPGTAPASASAQSIGNAETQPMHKPLAGTAASAETAASPSVPPAAAPPAPMVRKASPGVSGDARREDVSRSRAEGVAQGALPATASPALGEAIETTLTPEQWLHRIIEARRAGRHEEAGASLARFVAIHSATQVPPEAWRGQP